MSFIKQREFAIILFVIPLLFILFNYYTGIATPAAGELTNWGASIWNFSMILGTYSLFRKHGMTIAEKGRDWQYSVLMFVSFAIYWVASYINPTIFQFILDYIQTPITMSLIMSAFTQFTMMFRGARTRNWLGIILLSSAIITALRMTPIGILIWPGFYIIGNWINAVPNVGVVRAITIGMGIGLLATMVREILGKEYHYLGE